MTQVKVYRNSKDTHGSIVTLQAVRERILDGKRGLDEKTRYCNATATTDPQAYKPYKETQLPAVTFSGIFPKGKRKAQHLVDHSGLITIDIDGLPPEQIPDLLAELAQMPHVVLAFVSPSGLGIKVIVRVDPIPANDLEHKGAYQACLDFFEDLASEYSFEIDTSGKDCSRMCFLAHDPLAIFHTDTPTIHWDKEAWITAEKVKLERFDAEAKKAYTGEADVKALDYIDPNDLSYNQWLSMITAGKAAKLSWQQMDAWSQRGGIRYTEGEVETRWDGLNLDVSWGAVVNLAKANGYTPQHRSNTPKLSKPAHTAIPEPGIITLAESERLRNIASEKFINSPADSNVLQINTSQDDTGSGKTTTGLTTAAEAKQRTLGLAETTPLAGQLAIQAGECGFKNPLQLHGRGTGWKDDDDTDTASFETHLCPEYPMIQMIEPYRIPARWYCETKCDHKAECLDFGYLSQFKGLDEHDFISTANPNLFFDPHLRGYLKSLVSVENEQESDISLAFDAMTGGGSPREKKSLDYGIIDDYSIASLFTDITWIDREFKRVKKEWGTGTPTSRFASKVLKAFKEKKPQKIMKSLRKAYDETADDHKEITERLTQHARHGTVVKVWLPKHHTLSQKAVEYVDGGKQFIPNPDYEPTHEQVMLLAIDLPITENKPLDESKDDSGKYKDVRLERIRKDYAYKRLTNDNIPCIRADKLDPHTAIDEKVIVPHTFQTALAAGVKVKDLTPRWQSGSTPIQLLKLLFDYVQNDKNAPVSIRYTLSSNTQKPSAILSFSIPPQAPVGILNHLSMLSATVVPDDLRKVLKGQPVEITEQGGKSIEWADDIKGFQYSDARLTSGSVFEYQKDTDGKRILQQKPTGLTSLAIERLAKINDWAKQTDGLTGFISYKDLADDFCEHLDGFDVITHFDRVAGLNFEGLKLLVVFGHPKVSHEVVMSHARQQYASDSEPLPKGIPDLQDEHGNPISEYLQLTTETEYTEHGYTITERRYNDPRLESIRRQLATDKLRQATGRARFVRWSGTTIVIFTNSPIPCITEKVEHFGNDAFNAADSARDLPAAQKRVNDAIESGDVKAVMETKGVGKSQAYEQTKGKRSQQKVERDARVVELHQQGKNKSEIHRDTGIPRKTVSDIIHRYEQGGENSDPLLVYTYRQSENPPPPTNTDDTGVESEPLHTCEPDAQTCDTSPPIPFSEYSSLDLETANQELKRCQERNNYNGAAFLRSHIQKRERQLRTLKKGNTMDYYNILTIPGSELFAKIKEINAIANDDTSPEQETAIDALNNLSSFLEQRCGSREESLVAPGQVLSFGTVSLPLTQPRD